MHRALVAGARRKRGLLALAAGALLAIACTPHRGVTDEDGGAGAGGDAAVDGGGAGTAGGSGGIGGASTTDAGGADAGLGGATGGVDGAAGGSGSGGSGDDAGLGGVSGTAGTSGPGGAAGLAGRGGAGGLTGGGGAGRGGAAGTASGGRGGGIGGGAGAPARGGSGGGAAGGSAGQGGGPGPCAGTNLRGPTLVALAAGTLAIGASDLNANTQPVHSVQFRAFCIDRTEVTLADYKACVAAGGCTAPNTASWPGCNWSLAGRDNHPVTCVDWARAHAFCAWAGKRLPTEKEWEYAARGAAGRIYPWGPAAPSAQLANWNNLVGTTTAVGAYPAGATPGTGVVDLAGNVWEWTDSIWCDSYAANATCDTKVHVARGGSFASADAAYVRPAWRDPISAGDDRFGFRCALGNGETP